MFDASTDEKVAKVLAEDLLIGESPRWHDGGCGSRHWGAHEVIALDVRTGEQEVVLRDEDVQPHSISWLPDVRMLVVPGRDGDDRVLHQEPDGRLVTHADLGALGGWWNEIVVDGRGNVYVDSVGFDFMAFLDGRGAPAAGRIALITPEGAVRCVAEGIEFGNGMVVSPDNRTWSSRSPSRDA